MILSASGVVADGRVRVHHQIEYHVAALEIFRAENEPVDRSAVSVRDTYLGFQRFDSIRRDEQLHRAIRSRPFGPLDPDIIGRVGHEQRAAHNDDMSVNDLDTAITEVYFRLRVS